jgi:CxxC motif-containing protein (DUF1111 family)
MAILAIAALSLYAQTDPGPRGGPAGAGGSYPSLNAFEKQFFTESLEIFKEIDSVSGGVAGEEGSGLGPAFNGNSCAMCHAQPAIGGSSPGLKSKQFPMANPQIALATLQGATNRVPPFLSLDGPIREARFVRVSTDPNSAPDGGVHALFTIQGRTDAPGCNLAQPDFAAHLAANNVVFRIPTPTFGLGLVEATPDQTLIANLNADAAAKRALGISGHFNLNGNDGTIARFGWKAQNKSLLIFAGEAYNVEQGVSNELFPNERSSIAGCIQNGSPEDATHIHDTLEPHGDAVSFAAFMRLLAPPAAATSTDSERNGQALFTSTGCALCHTPSLTAGASRFTGLTSEVYQAYSDFAVHGMGSNLADSISQGDAGGDEFRTAPLWGLGQRLFFLHDGRTSDLLEAIRAHASPGPDCPSQTSRKSSGMTCASEANGVISKFNALTQSQKQDILNFLRSL